MLCLADAQFDRHCDWLKPEQPSCAIREHAVEQSPELVPPLPPNELPALPAKPPLPLPPTPVETHRAF
jgi:hypothetical protein